jgi:hypothetical protein
VVSPSATASSVRSRVKSMMASFTRAAAVIFAGPAHGRDL